MRTLLFSLQKLPYTSPSWIEAIETILFASSFGHEVSVLFSEEGVWQLAKPQQPTAAVKNPGNMISAFPSFDIHSVWICEEDLAYYQLHLSDLILAPRLVSKNGIGALMQQSDIVIHY